MSNRRPTGALLLFVSAAAVSIVVGSTSCLEEVGDTCQQTSDCLKGERCEQGTCVPSDGDEDTGTPPEDTGGGEETAAESESTCDDGNDNDGDGDTDCFDEDCEGEFCRTTGARAKCVHGTSPQCQGGESGDECDNTRDDDRDKLTDCDDPDCEDSCRCVRETQDCREICLQSGMGDTVDDDSDGITDEGCNCRFEGEKTGICDQAIISYQTEKCLKPSGYEDDESLCDGEDNDCDGAVDEGCRCTYLEKNKGVCLSARIDEGTGDCAEPQDFNSSNDNCDGIDNDCDGQLDEDESCSRCRFKNMTEGVCSRGIPPQGGSGDCQEPTHYEDPERTCDGLDNDCDGTIDEDCFCSFQPEGSPKPTNVGICKFGVINSSNGDCDPPQGYVKDEKTKTMVSDDKCDGLDNDCNGTVDEGCDICVYAHNQSLGVCQFGRQGDSGCEQPKNFEQDETSCDRRDNDCDGVIDEGCSCVFDDKSDGVCLNAERDEQGVCTVPSTYSDTESECGDGIDNDCDGDTDCADSHCSGESCGESSQGTCSSGLCDGGETSCEDGDDNDGDGATDCADADCAGSSCGEDSNGTCDTSGFCLNGECDDSTDNDGDGRTDCADSDCSGACTESDCTDGMDNDSDGDTDETCSS